MSMTNKERVDRGFEHLRRALVPWVEGVLRARHGKSWADDVLTRNPRFQREGASIRWDTYAVLKVMLDNWRDLFQDTLGHGGRSWASELFDVRNAKAHDRPIGSDDAYRA